VGRPPAAGIGLSLVVAGDPALARLIEAIVAGDKATFDDLLAADPELASATVAAGATRAEAKDHFFGEIAHYVYAGDTALHMAAAAHAPDLVQALVSTGSDVGAVNRRGAQPLHYAVDGGPNGSRWDPAAQAATIERLLNAGAEPDATDKGGTTPLHRAIRNRSAAAVGVLLERGADARRPNGSGSTAWQLAQWTTGKGGSGTAAAKAQQAEIQRLLESYDAVTG
jgi:Ankyrin repeats (many copies)